MVIEVMRMTVAAVVVASKCGIVLHYKLQRLYGVGVDERVWSIDTMTMTREKTEVPGETLSQCQVLGVKNPHGLT